MNIPTDRFNDHVNAARTWLIDENGEAYSHIYSLDCSEIAEFMDDYYPSGWDGFLENCEIPYRVAGGYNG